MSATSAPNAWWRDDPYYQEISGELDGLRAIDIHTHLLQPGSFHAEADDSMPFRLHSTEPTYARAMAERFGVSIKDGLVEAARRASKIRSELIEHMGVTNYWHDHLHATKTDIALVNQPGRAGTEGDRLRWVPIAAEFLPPPFRDDAVKAPDPTRARANAIRLVQRPDLGPRSHTGGIDEYLGSVIAMLTRWREDGAVAVSLPDAHLPRLTPVDVAEEIARSLYEKGRRERLEPDEHLAVQSFIAREVMVEAGKLDLAVHIDRSQAAPSCLPSRDTDARTLESILDDARFSGTRFVLLHGGEPGSEDAARLAGQLDVWIDLSVLSHLHSIPELAAILRVYLRFAPGKILFGTNASSYPGVPVGPEIHHLALCQNLREALALALARMVRDQLFDVERAIDAGKGVLRENAERLLGDHLAPSAATTWDRGRTR